ncbi:hypothetical protein PVAND_006742 [Polypedilum vanderplanki]|uniref:U2A'/phosphoprotein 32 family A C-terminal domain-containing protein n=1 Tax=Polypedilum vanderplanki TaxID=319348 RepID=A0A9J6C451_POLVA|nr:hypothetical protein PVAND_006742 [Polypedilum vanderplanki]
MSYTIIFSVNKIGSLADFEECPNLQELYLRKNCIEDINDLVYLQNLPKLKYLWLEENPCVEASGPNYRKIVLRSLPNLKKLDNIEVTPEEVRDAMRAPIDTPSQQSQQQQIKDESYDDDFEQSYRQQAMTSGFRGHSPVREQLPQQSMQQSPEGTESECASDPIDRPPSVSSPMQRTPSSHHQHQENFSPSELNNTSSPRYHNNRSQQSYERSPEDSPQISGNYRDQRGGVHMSTSMSTHSMKDYYQPNHQPPSHYRHSQSDLTGGNGEWEENNQNGNHREYPVQGRRGMMNNGSQDRYPEERREFYQYRNGNVSREDFGEELRRGRSENTVISTSVLNHLTGLHRRPMNRSSNLLSACLCLIKELDYSSLEVVEHAVRCRIDELAETM